MAGQLKDLFIIAARNCKRGALLGQYLQHYCAGFRLVFVWDTGTLTITYQPGGAPQEKTDPKVVNSSHATIK